MEAEVGDNWEEWEKKKQDLLKFCMEGNWGMVVDMYDKYPSLQNAKLSTSGETALHIAVWESAEDIVHRLVELIDKQSERRWQTPSALWIPNHRGNTPLHLAALIGNVGMCMCIAGKNEELLDLRNKAGETPLFLAALRGKKDAFLYLHQICGAERQYEYHRRHRDGQTILHVAIIGEYFDLAYEIICKYDDRLIYAVNEKGCTPLHLLASQPDVFRSGSRLGGFLSRIIYHCLPVEKLKETPPDYTFQPTCTDMHAHLSPVNKTRINFFQPLLKLVQNMIKRSGLHVEKPMNEPVPVGNSLPTFKGKMKPEKYPANYKTCINFVQPLLKMLHNMIKRPGKPSSNVEAEEGRPLLFPPNYHTSIMIIKTIWRAMLVILDLIGLIDIQKLQEKKEKNIWSVQIMDLMLLKSSHRNYYSSFSGCHPGLMKDFPDSYEPENTDWYTAILKEELSSKQPIQGTEAPILLAAKNGITKMVERILDVFPMAILDRDSDGKNIVLLAVENRQTKLYEQLVQNILFNESAFRAVDNKGNSALHLAARIGDFQPYPFAALQMQWEIKWFKYVKYSVPQDFFMNLNNEDMTPKEVFRTSHKDLVKEGAKWLTATSNSCSLVATLVTTVAFATTATVPGGLKEGSSSPNLGRHPAFIVFATSSLIALSFSATSVIAFLSILTSRYHQKDFQSDLPRKLLLALTSLFMSLAAMLFCFCAAHFFLVKDKFEHTSYLVIYAIACLPIAYFAMMQFPFYFALVLQTFKRVPQRTPFT
ncbi:hypothetical protein VitviT2T_022782 [Vitis vinifera]|uniref:PGG domain-containing protein n=2 Tax=Vitis vinifera TaxID=29760 RepID=A0A438GTY1_VITVI|nr:uncharacterized protein LOC100267645 [Vitis vinifera]RVW75653.1 hypothetical protein CK203_055275 [Vitis vinifera]WKA04775.1 hypothetical protein VitviT2T_022782 [Vitis vinifera]|eukprot:XP_010661176.1 PREDICTED: uncharacterized protein LOC100267645 [Vitis vinifera]